MTLFTYRLYREILIYIYVVYSPCTLSFSHFVGFDYINDALLMSLAVVIKFSRLEMTRVSQSLTQCDAPIDALNICRVRWT